MHKNLKIKPNRMKINYFIRIVCDRMEVNSENIRKRIRTERIAYARHMIAYFLYNYTSFCLMEVAMELCRKDHQTIINSLEVCDKILDNDKGYKYNKELKDLIQQVGAMPRIPKRWKKQNQLVSCHPETPPSNPQHLNS